MNLLFNGDFTTLPANPVTQTTGLRWINGSAHGYFTNTYGWYLSDNTLNGSSAKFNVGGDHQGGGSLTLSNTTLTGKTFAITPQFNIQSNHVYKISGYVKTVNVPANGVGIKVNFYDAGKTIAWNATGTNRVSGNNDCVLVTGTFTALSSIVTVELDNMASGALCSATFHDITLTEVIAPVVVPMNQTIDYGVNAPFDIVGSSWTTQQLQNYCDKVIGFGGKWIRASFVFPYIHPVGSTTYNYSAYDNFVSIVQAKGLNILPIISFAAPVNQEFTNYFTNIAQHFSTKGIRYYELWNEQNLTGTYNSNNSPNYYASLIKAAYPALKAGDPKCKVLFSGVTGNTIGVTSGNLISPADFLQGVYDAGGGNSFDIMNYHPYGQTEAVIQAIRQVMFNNGDETKELWFTEDGIPTGGKSGFTDEAGQAAYLLNGIALAKKYSANKYLIYNGNDSVSKQPDREGYFGITKGTLDNLVNKQSYNSIKTAILG